MGRLGSTILLGLAACASSVPRTVPRVVDGRVEDGVAVSPYAYEWFVEGEVEATKGRHGQAAMAFENATAAPGTDVYLVTRLAEEYEMSGAARRADRAITLARRYHGDSARVALAEGRIHRNRGEIDAALASFSRAGRLAPTSSEPVVATADALAARGHYERAGAVLLEFLRATSPEESGQALRALLALARRTGDAQMLERALTFEVGTTADTRAYAAGELALATGQPALAVRILDESREVEPNVRLWLDALDQSGDRERAAGFVASPSAARLADVEERAESLLELRDAERTLEILAAADRSPRVQTTRGRALQERGAYVAAATTLAAVPLGAATYESSRLALADCSVSLGRSGAAAEALSLAPHASTEVRAKLAEIFLGEGDLRAGLRLFDPRQPSDRAAVASIFEKAGHYEEAAAYYSSVEVTTGTKPRLRARASAEQLASRGFRKGAIAILEQWAAIAPEDLYSRVRLVELLREERRLSEARRRAEQILPVVDDAMLRAHLGRLTRSSGDR